MSKPLFTRFSLYVILLAALPEHEVMAQTALPGVGSNLDANRRVINLYRVSAGDRRFAQTLQLNQLSSNQRDAVQKVLALDIIDAERIINVNSTDAQVDQIQSILAVNQSSRSDRYDYAGPLPTVRSFARWLVMLGVSSATVWLSLAAWCVVRGNNFGEGKVIATAGGLMLLLCGYTIWKIIQMNTFGAN